MIKKIVQQIIVILSSMVLLTLVTWLLHSQIPLQNQNQILANTQIDQSRFTDIFHYVSDIIVFDFGRSVYSGQSVLNEFLTHFPATLELVILSILVALGAGIPLGIYAARNKHKWQDNTIISSTLIGYSLPVFWWGILLVLFFSLFLNWTPVAGRLGLEYDIRTVTGFILIDTLLSNKPYAFEAFMDALHHMFLPIITLATIPLAVITRVTRNSMIDILKSNYIKLAIAKGVSQTRVVWIHALRNAMLPIVTNVSLLISVLLTGSLLVEIIFSWPGAAKWLLDAVHRRDYAVIHGGIFLFATFIILTNALFETLRFALNPNPSLEQ